MEWWLEGLHEALNLQIASLTCILDQQALYAHQALAERDAAMAVFRGQLEATLKAGLPPPVDLAPSTQMSLTPLTSQSQHQSQLTLEEARSISNNGTQGMHDVDTEEPTQKRRSIPTPGRRALINPLVPNCKLVAGSLVDGHASNANGRLLEAAPF